MTVINVVTRSEIVFKNKSSPVQNLVTAAIVDEHPGLKFDRITRKAYKKKVVTGKIYAALGNWVVKIKEEVQK